MELRRRRWTLVRWGPEHALELVAAYFRWRTCTDVLLLRGADSATGYRVPTTGGEIFNPTVVAYQYHDNPLWTLRAMLSLPAPGELSTLETPMRPECFIPNDLPQPVLLRPLSVSS